MLRKRSKRSKPGKRRNKRKTPHQRWLIVLRQNFGAFDHDKPEGREYLLAWTTNPPPRIPMPSGPSPGATMTVVNQVNGFNVISGNTTSLSLQQNSATPVLGAIAFVLNDLNQASTFASMFDQYRFEEVHFRLTTRNNAVSTFLNAATTEDVPYLLFVVDRDDSTAVGTLPALGEYDNVQQISGISNLDIILQPSVAPAIFSGGAFSGYSIARGDDTWVDIANLSVPHYGIKFGISALDVSTTAKWSYDITAWYKISFRNVR